VEARRSGLTSSGHINCPSLGAPQSANLVASAPSLGLYGGANRDCIYEEYCPRNGNRTIATALAGTFSFVLRDMRYVSSEGIADCAKLGGKAGLGGLP
jgi:hypothetical protein